MTNKAFYTFCRDQRKTEEDPHKKWAFSELLSEVDLDVITKELQRCRLPF